MLDTMNDTELTWLANPILCAMIQASGGKAPTKGQIDSAAWAARQLEQAVRANREQAGTAAG
jgi:hypothetical protein